MLDFLKPYRLYFAAGAAAVVILVVGLAYADYKHLQHQVVTLSATVSTQQAQVDSAVQLAKDNAAAAEKAILNAQVSIRALEESYAEIEEQRQNMDAARSEIDAAKPDDDGSVAPVLQRLNARLRGAR